MSSTHNSGRLLRRPYTAWAPRPKYWGARARWAPWSRRLCTSAIFTGSLSR